MRTQNQVFVAKVDSEGRITDIRRKPSRRKWVTIVVAAVVVAVIVALAAMAQAAVIPDYRDFGGGTDIECEDGWAAFRRAAVEAEDWEVIGIMAAMDEADAADLMGRQD